MYRLRGRYPVRGSIERARRKVIGSGVLRDLYVRRQLPVTALAEILGVSESFVRSELLRHGFPLRGARNTHSIRHPELRELKIGESLDLPAGRKDRYVRFYQQAAKAGIRVSVRTVDEGTVRVTRKA